MSRRVRCVMCAQFVAVDNVSVRGWCLGCEAELERVKVRATELHGQEGCESSFACVAAGRCLRVRLRLVKCG